MRKPGVDNNSDGKPVTFDVEMMRRLIEVHHKAVAEGKEMFVFDERSYSTRYAHYLIEYLKKVFGEPA